MKNIGRKNLFIKLFTLLFILATLSCERDVDVDDSDSDSTEVELNEDDNTSDHEQEDDYVWNEDTVVEIELNKTSISCSYDNVSIVGTVATITTAATYRITGSLTDGQIIVNTDDDETVRLLLDDVNIYCSTSSPIYILSADKTIIYLEEGTENYLSDGTSYTYDGSEDDDANATLYSKDDLTIYGEGSLAIDANFNDGITSKDGLIITSGTISVNAHDDGIRGKDYLIVNGGDITVVSDGDGLCSDEDEDATKGYISLLTGNYSIDAAGDAISAETDLYIYDGTFDLTSGGGSSTSSSTTSSKGLKAGLSLNIETGIFVVNCSDDAIHSDGDIIIYDGNFTIASGDDGMHAGTDLTIDNGTIEITESYEGIESYMGAITLNVADIYVTSSDDGFNVSAGGTSSSGRPSTKSTNSDYTLYINGAYVVMNAGGDGLDSNEDIEVTDGIILVCGPTADNNSALDYDGTFNMNGGFLIAAGSNGMAEAPSSSSSQNSVLIDFNSSQSAGTLVTIQNANGDNIVTFSPTKSYESIVFSSSDLTPGVSYSVYKGGSSTGTNIDGFYEGGDYSGGSKFSDFTTSSTITYVD